MFCPKCGGEYRPGFKECFDCGVALVEQLSKAESPSTLPPADSPAPDSLSEPLELVTVLKTGEPGLLAVAKSLLQSADIRFMTQGELVQDLAGWGHWGTGYNFIFGPAEIRVRSEDAEDARELLKDLDAGCPEPDDAEDGSEDDP